MLDINYIYVAISICVVLIILLFIGIIIRYNNIPNTVCDTGLCPTSISTGEKDCTRSSYNPLFEVCNSPNKCDHELTPYPLNTDLSTNTTGICESYNCRCLTKNTCPDYINATFDGEYRQKIITNPYISNGQFCTITASSIRALGCNTVQDCMANNICATGQLAYIGNPSEITTTSAPVYPLGCIKYSNSSSLPQGASYIWDVKGREMVTKTL